MALKSLEDKSTHPPHEDINPLLAKRPDLATTDRNVGTRFPNSVCRYSLLVKHFKPGADYNFPKGSSKKILVCQPSDTHVLFHWINWHRRPPH